MYYNEGGVTVSSVTSPPSVDEDGYMIPVNQPATVSQSTTNPEQKYESLGPVSPQPTELISGNTYQTLTVDAQDYVIVP